MRQQNKTKDFILKNIIYIAFVIMLIGLSVFAKAFLTTNNLIT